MTARDVGAELRRIRETAGVSLEQLADESTYTAKWLRQLERGKQTRRSTLTKVAEALARLAGLDPARTVEILVDAAGGEFLPEAPDRHRRSTRARVREQLLDRPRRRELLDQLNAARDDPDAMSRFLRDAFGIDTTDVERLRDLGKGDARGR